MTAQSCEKPDAGSSGSAIFISRVHNASDASTSSLSKTPLPSASASLRMKSTSSSLTSEYLTTSSPPPRKDSLTLRLDSVALPS